MKEIKLTIIIPLYNAEKFLDRCLNSIVLQLTDEVELFLINDGSLDNSLEICNKFLLYNKNIFIIDKKNEGCSIARNKGINLANGKYLWFIDSDDYIEKDCVSKILKNLETNIDVLVFGYKKVINGKYYEILPMKLKTNIDMYAQTRIFNSPCNKIYNKELVIQNSINFPIDSHMGEDMVFNFKVFYFSKNIKIMEESFYNYVDTDGVTSNLAKRIEIFNSFDEIFNFFIKNGSFYKMKQILKEKYIEHAIKAPYNVIMYQATKKKIDKKIEIEKIRREIKIRHKIFNSSFLLVQLFYTLKMKIYFLKPFYKKLQIILKR